MKDFRPKGFVYGLLSIFLGGMFGFPVVLIATYKAQRDPIKVLLGVTANQ